MRPLSLAHADPSSTTSAQGFDRGEVPHARGTGMSQAEVAMGPGTSAVLNNPANLHLTKVYHVEGLFSWMPEARRQTYGVAASDSFTSRLGAGLSFTWNHLDPQGIDRTWIDVRVPLSFKIGDRLLIGAAGRYIRITQDTTYDEYGDHQPEGTFSPSPLFQRFTFDAGITAIPFDKFYISVLGKNLTFPNRVLAPTQLIPAIGFNATIIAVEANLGFDFHSEKGTTRFVRAGVEFYVSQAIALRAGYRYDERDQNHGGNVHAASLGAALLQPTFSLEVSYKRDLYAEHENSILSAGFQLFFEGSQHKEDSSGD